MYQYVVKNSNTIIATLIMAGLLIFNFILNSPSFYTPHANGDQRSYVGIAMKLDRYGFQEYNIKRINVSLDEDGILKYYYSADDEKGDYLRYLEDEGLNFYNQPLFHAPPLFSYLIVASHKLFASGQPYTVVPREDERFKSFSNQKKIKAQFYCTIVPIIFSLLLIITSFFLGKTLYSTRVGLFSAALISITPINMLAAQRIWADGVLSVLISLTVLLYYRACVQKSLRLIILSGLIYSFALLTKNSAIILVITILACVYLFLNGTKKSLFKTIIYLGVFFITVIFITWPWYAVVIKTFGSLIYNPYQEGISRSHQWFQYINSRPWYTYVIGIPMQVPLFFLGYMAMVMTVIRGMQNRKNTILMIWFLSHLIILTVAVSRSEMLGPDHRYMLPSYPALAVLTSYYMVNIRNSLNQRFGSVTGDITLGICFLICSCWSLKVGLYYTTFDNLIRIPF